MRGLGDHLSVGERIAFTASAGAIRSLYSPGSPGTAPTGCRRSSEVCGSRRGSTSSPTRPCTEGPAGQESTSCPIRPSANTCAAGSTTSTTSRPPPRTDMRTTCACTSPRTSDTSNSASYASPPRHIEEVHHHPGREPGEEKSQEAAQLPREAEKKAGAAWRAAIAPRDPLLRKTWNEAKAVEGRPRAPAPSNRSRDTAPRQNEPDRQRIACPAKGPSCMAPPR